MSGGHLKSFGGQNMDVAVVSLDTKMKANIILFLLFLYKQTLMKCLSFDVHVNDTFCLQTIVNKLSDFIVND
jgi:hypothetical protein